MALYTFHAFNAKDAPIALEAAEAADDAAAIAIGRRLLADHASASHIVVYLGDREIADCRRG